MFLDKMGKPNRHVANLITFTRIIGVILLFWFTPYTTNFVSLLVCILFIVIALTDFLDGWIARKYQIVSDLGKVLDPLADKLLVLVFLPLLSMQVINAFPVFVILAREFSIMALRILSAKQGIIIPASISGKIKTALTFPLCGILLARVPVTTVKLPPILKILDPIRLWIFNWPEEVITIMIWTTVIVTVWSFMTYLKDFIWQNTLTKANNDIALAKKQIQTLIPLSITFGNFCCGVVAILFALLSQFHISVFLIMIGMVLDVFDGYTARRFDVGTEQGAKLDSVADLVTFGVAPSIMILMVINNQISPYSTLFGILLGFIYFFAVLYRLKRFDEAGHSDFFTGFPSPAAASIVILTPLSPWIQMHSFLFPFIVLMTSFFMVSTITYTHLGYATRHTYLKYLSKPAFLAFVLCLLKLLNINWMVPIPAFTIFLIFVSFYLTSTFFIKRNRDK